MSAGRYRDTVNPLVRLAVKQKVGQAEADKIALAVLLALDAAKRSAAPAPLANVLTDHLMTGVLLWARLGNRALYDKAAAAWMAMAQACKRPTQLLDLTTTEYKAIRDALRNYLLAIPQLEVGVLASIFLEAQRKLNG